MSNANRVYDHSEILRLKSPGVVMTPDPDGTMIALQFCDQPATSRQGNSSVVRLSPPELLELLAQIAGFIRDNPDLWITKQPGPLVHEAAQERKD